MTTKTYEDVVREDAPEVFLRLDEASGTTAADATRFGRDFTHAGSPTLDQAGPVSKAVSYDGTDDETTYSVNMPITGYPFTVKGWLQTPGSTANSTEYCRMDVGDASADTDGAYIALYQDGSGNLNVRVECESGGTEDTKDYRIPNALKGEWVFVAVQYVSATERNVYANGVLIGTASTNISFPANLDKFSIGNVARSTSDFVAGVVAEPGWFNYQLIADRIRIHHAVGRGYTDTDSYGYAMITSGPSIWLRLQEASGTDAADASGNKRDFTHSGGPTLDQTGPLADGTTKAVSYDGSDDQTLYTADSPLSGFPAVIMGWLKTPGTTTSSTSYPVISFGDKDTGQDQFYVDLRTDGSNDLQVLTWNDVGGSDSSDPKAYIPNNLKGSFVHIAVRWVSATERHLYVNGALVASETASISFPTNIDTYIVGRVTQLSLSQWREGEVAEPAWFNRDVSESEIRNIYAKGKQYLETNFRTKSLAKCPSIYWRQGESSGSTAADETAFGRDGTIAGGVTLGQTGAVVDDADTAMLFDGVDGQITYSESFITQYPVTLEALVKLPGTIGASTSYIRVGLTDASGTMKMVAGLKTDSNTQLRAFAEEVGTSTGTINNDCGGKVTNYHHLIVELISDTSRKVRLNGVELEEETTSVSITLANLDTVCVGVEDLGTDAWYEGYCDEFLLYQRQLSETEKLDQYVASLGFLGEPVHGVNDNGYIQLALEHAPTLLWPQNEASGTDALAADRWGRDGTYANGFTLEQDGPNSNLSAVQYDGTDGEAAYSDANDMPIKGYPFAIEAWLQSPSTLAISTSYVFFGIADSASTDDQFGVQLITSGGGDIFARGYIRVGGTDDHIDQNSGSGLSVQNNKWLHCVLVCRDATDRELYVQGRSAGTDATSITFPSTLDTVAAGKLPTSTPSFFEGFMAMGKFFDHEPTEAEILARFMAGRAIFEGDNPYLYEVGQLVPAAHYRLNEDSGTTAADLLGLRDLTIAGSPTLDQDGPLYNKSDDGAIALDGTDDEATLADDAQVTAYPTAYVGWIATPASPDASDVFAQMGMGDDGTGDNVLTFGLETDGSSNVTAAGYLSTGGTADNVQPSSPVLEEAVFHHIIWVQRDVDDRELYVNGVSVATDTDSRTFPSSLDDILLGVTAGGTFREGTIAEFSILTSDVSDSEALDLYLAAFKALTLVINRYERSISDTVSVDDQIALAFLSSITDTIEVSDEVQLSWIKSLSDSVGLADTISAVMTFVNAVSDSVSVADSVNNILKAIASIEDTVETSEVINARGVFIRSMSDSIEAGITINVSGVEYVGLVLNTTNMAISTYSGWDFNSFAQIGDSYIGAGRAGVYELGGEDDDGTDIEWEIDLGSIDFGNSQDKRLPEIFYACRSDGTILFKVTHVQDDGSKVENWYQATRTSDALTERRVKLKKGVKSQYYRVELMGKDGSRSDLEKIELTPMVLMRKL